MRRSAIIWGGLLILAGILLLLNSLGIIAVNVWEILWPMALILFGLWLLVGARGRGTGSSESRSLAFQLKGYERAAVGIHYGAGRLTIDSGAAPDELLSGTFAGGVEHQLHPDGDLARVELRSPVDWSPGTDRAWDVSLNGDLPLSLDVETGASETLINLRQTKVGDLRLRSGASSVNLILPAAAGETAVDIEGGAGSVVARLPDGVAARIEGGAVLGTLDVDETRFPRAGSVWQSPDYDAAANKADIHVKFGVGEVKIR